jgi:hypothetical protein
MQYNTVYVPEQYKESKRSMERYGRFKIYTILGKKLPGGSVVHHVNENGLDDSNNNLVLCEDASYHRLLHLRTAALKATGNPHARRCRFCKQWDIPGNGDFVHIKRTCKCSIGDGRYHHRSCAAKYARERKIRRIANANRR